MVIAVIIGPVTPSMAIALVISGRLADVDQLRVFWANWPFLWGCSRFCC
jgi:TRAP-type C4-dicarboxylate transport system permease large subunit